MIREEEDASLVNRITNASSVKPFISRHGGDIDWTPAIGNPDCVILSNGEDACIVFERNPGTRDWQCNTIFAPTCRGKRAVETGIAMRDYMLDNHADCIFGSIPDSFRHAVWFYRQMGGIQIPEFESGGERYVAQDNETLFALRRAV